MWEKPKIPSKAELERKRQSKRNGLQKHVYLNFSTDKLITEYSRKLKKSQSEVIELLIYNGLEKFEIIYGFKLLESIPIDQRKKTVDTITLEINERYKKVVAERKRRDTGKELADAYMRKLIFDWSDKSSGDWERVQ